MLQNTLAMRWNVLIFAFVPEFPAEGPHCSGFFLVFQMMELLQMDPWIQTWRNNALSYHSCLSSQRHRHQLLNGIFFFNSSIYLSKV